MSISQNIAEVRRRMAEAARRAARDPAEIALMAVSKTQPAERIREAYDAGLRLFGENRVQEFAGKAEALGIWLMRNGEMIGHLQTNKAAKAAELFQRRGFGGFAAIGGKIECCGWGNEEEAGGADRDQCRRRGGEERCGRRNRKICKNCCKERWNWSILSFAD